MLELLIATTLGIFAGAFTGCIPGIHPNTVIFSSFPVYFSSSIGFPLYITFIAGLSVSHTFHDFLPAIYLRAPSSETALASIEGFEEEGQEDSFELTVTGGLIAATVFLLLSPVLFYLLKPVYSLMTGIMPIFLGFFLFFIIVDNWRPFAPVIAAFSALIGVFAFRMPVNQNFILMPVFTGLFAVPAVFESLTSDIEIPSKGESTENFSVKGGFLGFISGLIAGTVPGVGAGGATSFLSPLIDDRKELLTGLGAVNTTDIFVSFIALFVLGKARSGASVAIQTLGTLDKTLFVTALGSSFVAVGLTLFLTSRTESVFLKFVNSFRIDYVLILVLSVVFVVTVWFTGLGGVLVLLTSSFVGLLAWRKNCRICCMSVLIVPALLFYLGVGIFI